MKWGHHVNNDLKNYRQDLHQIPELGFDLFKTSEYIKEKLISFGYHPIKMAKTGWVIVREGKIKEALLFRTDMDALPVNEQTGVTFESKHQGKMHACGHDGHMSMMLGFAKYVMEQPKPKHTIVMIFQPAEEGPGGAKVMIEEGLFDMFSIKHVFGIHLYPELEEGLYGLIDGPMMARNGEFNLSISGQSAHAAQPHKAKDAIQVAGHLISSYHEIVSRHIDPLDQAVVTIGTIHGGEARNIIAQSVTMTGTIRAFHDSVYEKIKEHMHRIDQGLSIAFDVAIHNDIMDYYPAVNNDHQLYVKLVNALEPISYRLIKPMTFAEDFAFYQQKVPGMFVMLGTKREDLGYVHPLHSCYFNFDERVLIKGVELYQKILSMFE